MHRMNQEWSWVHEKWYQQGMCVLRERERERERERLKILVTLKMA